MLDLNKPVQLRFGGALTVLATNVAADIPGVPAKRHEGQTVLTIDTNGQLRYHHEDGAYDRNQGETCLDIVNAPPPPVVTRRFASLYPIEGEGDFAINTWADREEAEAVGTDAIRATIAITYTDGVPTGVELI